MIKWIKPHNINTNVKVCWCSVIKIDIIVELAVTNIILCGSTITIASPL